jgi:RIO-like serine/threonine protein kinase
MDKRLLTQIERYIISFFRQERQTRIPAKDLFESTSAYANADMVRALEDLEKTERLLVRHTTEGNDYVTLTAQGIELLGLEETNVENDLPALPHPPKSATKI